MIVSFEKEYLRDLYEKGKTMDKKHRFQPEIIKRYKERIKTLESAEKIEDLFAFKSLNYEVLKGDKSGISSIRVNSQNKSIMITLKDIDPNMIANNITPYEPTHPGEILKEEIEFRGISQRRLATQMGVSYSVLNEVLNSKRPVTTEYALLFEAALGVDACIFIRMQADYNMQTARQNKSFSERLANIRKHAAIL